MATEMLVQSSGALFVTPSDFRRNAVFYGFQIELEQLHKKLNTKEKRNIGPRAVLVHGGPGSGKSHLVREYVWRHRDDYPGGVFWIDARSEELLYQCFWNVAQSAALMTGHNAVIDGWDTFDRFIPAVRSWLEQRDGWLLVFDNLSLDSDEQMMALQPMLPDRVGSHIIYTSVNRTLARKQRLFHPSDVKVHPLSLEDARRLLYEGLDIERPSPQQQKKATEMVKHLDYLPLAIHALSFKLFATGKSIEKYQIGSYKTNSRIAEPYMEIMAALWENSHMEAIHLINLLSLLGHFIPIALIHLGRKGLINFSIEIRSPDQDGRAKRDLDVTIATLIKYGLVERALQPYTSPDRSVSLKNGDNANSEPATMTDSGSGLNGSIGASSHSSTGGIEILRIHTVAQSFCRDELLKDKEKFQWYLCAAVSMFCNSYQNAALIMKQENGGGLVRDFREYECHAAKLHSHFPKNPLKASKGLRQRRHELRVVLRSIKQEIQNRSPNRSSESVRITAQASVFDRTSSTSSNGPETPMSTPSRTSTWGFEGAVKHESPTNYRPSQGNELVSYGEDETIFHLSREDTGYISGMDENVWVESRRVSSGNTSNDTGTGDTPQLKSADQITASTSPVLRQIFQAHISSKPRKDLGEWRPRPSQPSITYSQAKADPTTWNPPGSSNLTRRGSFEDRFRPISIGSEAEARLAAFHRLNPPAARGGRVRSPSRPRTDDTLLPNPPSATGVHNENVNPSGLSALAPEFKPHDRACPQPEFIMPSIPTSRRGSLSAAATYGTNLPLLPVEENITFSRGPYGALKAPPSRIEWPLPQDYVTMSAILPSGYASQPMSRDGSKESQASMSTEPPRFKPTFSSIRGGSNLSPRTSPHLTPSRLAPIPIDGGNIRRRGVPDSSSVSPVSPIFEPSSLSSDVNFKMNRTELGNSVQFGDSDPVDLAAARLRTEEYQRKLPFERGDFRRRSHRELRPYPNQNMIPTPSDEGILRAMVQSQGREGSIRSVGRRKGLGMYRDFNPRI
ncbi:MAG: hypothetical protein Q9227_005122 [Pyrenula ochraceoflavens]